MFGFLKKRVPGTPAKENNERMDAIAGKIAAVILKHQVSLAVYLGKQFNRFSLGQQKIILIMAAIAMASLCMFRILSGIS